MLKMAICEAALGALARDHLQPWLSSLCPALSQLHVLELPRTVGMLQGMEPKGLHVLELPRTVALSAGDAVTVFGFPSAAV